MWGIDHVQEAILISLLLVDLAHDCGHASQAFVVHQEVEGLGMGQTHPISGGGGGGGGLSHSTQANMYKYHTWTYTRNISHCIITGVCVMDRNIEVSHKDPAR